MQSPPAIVNMFVELSVYDAPSETFVDATDLIDDRRRFGGSY